MSTMKGCKNLVKKFLMKKQIKRNVDAFFKSYTLKELLEELFFLNTQEVEIYFCVLHKKKEEKQYEICEKYGYSNQQIYRIRDKIRSHFR